MPELYIPERGDLIWLNFSPQIGREQSGRRPALILTPSGYNRKVKLGIFCPITSRVKGYPFEVGIPEGLAISGVILADHVRSLDWETRMAEYICAVPESVVQEVLDKLHTLLGNFPV